jgi:hypothetical protein
VSYTIPEADQIFLDITDALTAKRTARRQPRGS